MHTQTIWHQYQRQLLLLAVLTLALVARFRYITEIEHNVDHAYPVWQAMTTLDRGEFPLAGQGTSVLFANPALTGYLYIPAVAITRSPLGVYVFVIALNTLAVWMAYRATRTLTKNDALALIAAALMAVNPWVIEYSRTSWVQSLLPFFVCAVAWLLWPVLLGQSRKPVRRLALALTMTALLTQTYLLAYFILVPVGVLLVIFRRRLPLRGLVIGGAVILLSSGMYGIGLLGQIDTVRQRIDDFGAGASRLTTEAAQAAIRLITGEDYALARGRLAPADDGDLRQDLSTVMHIALLGALIVGSGLALSRLRQPSHERDAAIIVLLWFGLPILAMSYTGNPVHPFYQLLGLPAGYIIAAWGLGLIFRPHVRRFGRYALLALFLPFAALMLTNSVRYYQETAAIPGVHDLTALPVDYGMQLGQAINDSRDAGGVVFAQVEDWIINSFAGGLFDSIADTRAPGLTIFPAQGGVYVHFDDADNAPLPEAITTQHRITMPDRTLIADVLPPPETIDLPGNTLNVSTQQGITLVSYALTQEADSWLLESAWQVDGVSPEALPFTYTPFLHLIDATGERVLIVDGAGLPAHRWQVGDVHLHRMHFNPPEDTSGPYTLFVGQFDGLQNANVIFLPEDGEPSVIVTLPEQITE